MIYVGKYEKYCPADQVKQDNLGWLCWGIGREKSRPQGFSIYLVEEANF